MLFLGTDFTDYTDNVVANPRYRVTREIRA